MESRIIRQKFLEYFKEKGHKIVPSAPLVVKNDPTLMFTNAGMNQFKDFFLGTKESVEKRVADTQKCLRVSGKHNDLEEVGLDTYHHTMFEMLGNWSFGNYFKHEAIDWAWELLTEVYGLPADRLYATVFGGDKTDGLEVDNEARDYWAAYLPADRILDGSKEDNFWEMGDSGPCGPCSEIHIDLRPQSEIDKVSGVELVNNDHPQVVEVWNLVFIEFNRLSSGALEDLPAKNVDTGMGFERLTMAIQNKTSNYDTDIFQPLIKIIADKAGVVYGKDEKIDIALRVIVDHIRAISFAIADGQLPSNTGAGYVIRRILRRAVRYGFQFLGFTEPFLAELLPELNRQFADVFPGFASQQEFIGKVITEEEISFLRTLENGLKKLEVVKEQLNRSGDKVIGGVQAFELYDTFGFPLDLTSLIARENGFSVDVEAFNKEMQGQKDRSKADASKETGDWGIVHEGADVEFVGYEFTEAEAKILRYRKIAQKGKELYQIVLDKTPFYAESGGQVGDSGYLEANGEKVSIIDTKKENDLIVHFATKIPKDPSAVFDAIVNRSKRMLTMNNHSATHLMHAALREVLGPHVEQRGSLVNNKVLRFDFSHFSKMTEEEILAVENKVNEKIRANIGLDERRNVPIEEAKAEGAMALFGEKYGDFVRMIVFDPAYSVELCGGTHVAATGQIGLFKITSESSIAAGIRRIEAITAVEAEKYVQNQENLLSEINNILKHPKDLKIALANLLDEKSKMEKELATLQKEKVGSMKEDLIDQVKEINGVNTLFTKVDLSDAGALKQLGFDLKQQVSNLYLVLAANIAGKPQIAVVVSDNLVAEKGLNAGSIVKELAKEIKGGGGGQPFFATAGGSDVNGLDRVIQRAPDFLK